MKIALRALAVLLVLVAVAVLWVWYRSSRDFAQPPLAGTLQRATVEAGGLSRTLAYYVPAAVSPRPALVFALHGSGGSGEGMRRYSHYQFDVLADREGFVVVYPDGWKRHWNDCRRSADYAANTENVDDPAFFRTMIDYFVEHLHADRGRAFALGVSNGGHMAYRLALEMPQSFAALAAVAANLPVAGNLDCTASGQPVSIAIVNGTEDPLNPYNGGLVKVMTNTSRGYVRSTAETAAYWRGLAAADGPPVTTYLPETDGDPRTRIRLERWRGRGGIEVRVYTLEGSGHVLPARASSLVNRLLGGSARDIDAAPELWAFFSAAARARNGAAADAP